MYRKVFLFTVITFAQVIHAENVNVDTKTGTKNEEINMSYKEEVCTLVLKKLKSSFENLRAGNITDKKTSKVADLLHSYRLLNCENEKQLIDVLACTNPQIMFFDDCRKKRKK